MRGHRMSETDTIMLLIEEKKNTGAVNLIKIIFEILSSMSCCCCCCWLAGFFKFNFKSKINYETQNLSRVGVSLN